MKYLFLQILYIIFISINALFAQVTHFNPTPDWTSTAMNHVATGLGVADINQDGWDDIVVANGNDIYRQSVVVYHNDGTGHFPLIPSWSSADIDYHGHLAIGDINGDNLPDVAVSVFLGPAGFSEPGVVKVYFNTGSSLENTPSFQTADSMFTFSCALGDADGDGDLDLAVAGGQSYSIGLGPYQTNGRIYHNQNGKLDSLPGWTHLFPCMSKATPWSIPARARRGASKVRFNSSTGEAGHRPMRRILNSTSTRSMFASFTSRDKSREYLPRKRKTGRSGGFRRTGFPFRRF